MAGDERWHTFDLAMGLAAMNRQAPSTFADYLIVAISPLLIMLLVGSLAFFLIEVFYRGHYELRLTFVMAMFVMGTVCITRISMEEGTAYSAMFAIPLGVACAVAVTTFAKIEGPLAPLGPTINCAILLLIWWIAGKLVWNCTLLDRRADASGKSLLSTLVSLRGEFLPKPTETAQKPSEPNTDSKAPPQTTAWLLKFFSGDNARPHQPGIWVVYFSLIALPLFAMGQLVIPVADLGSRRWVFQLLVVYVTSALLLLLATSLLSIRKYLRSRQVEMPAEMAMVWTFSGLALALVVIVAAMLLPRPSPEYSFAQYAARFDAPDRQSSSAGAGSEGASQKEADDAASATRGSDDAKAGDESSGESNSPEKQTGDGGQPSSKTSESGKKSGDTPTDKSGEQSSQSGDDQQGEKRPEESQSGYSKGDSKSSTQQQGSKSSATEPKSSQETNGEKSPSEESTASQKSQQNQPRTASNWKPPPIKLSGVVQLLVWLFYLAVGVVALVFAWKYRDKILAAWNRFLSELRAWWQQFSRKPKTGADIAVVNAAARPKRFADYANPFASGMAQRWTHSQLLQYTLAAIDAWGRDHQLPREASQTLHEYALVVANDFPPIGASLRQFADLYGHAAFAPAGNSSGATTTIEQLWRQLETATAAAGVASGA